MSDYIGYQGTAAGFTNLLTQSRYQGVSPIGTYLGLAGGASPIEQIMELMRGVLEGAHPIFSVGGYAYLCYLLSSNPDFIATLQMSEPAVICAGLITAQWRLRPEAVVNDDEITLRVLSLMRYLVGHTGTLMADFKAAYEFFRERVLNSIEDAAADLIIPGTSAYLTSVMATVTGYGAKAITMLEGGMVPWASFGLNLATIRAATSRAELIAAMNPQLQEGDVNALNAEQILHCCNFIGRYHQEHIRTVIVKSIFISLAAICKGQNLTVAWTNSRWSTLKTQYESLGAFQGDINRETISTYANRFIGNNVDLGSLYSAMVFNHRLALTMQIRVMSWMIEQARGTNITGLHMIAEAFSKFDACTYTLVNQTVSENQFKEAIKAMVMTIRQPYGTLHGPLVAVQRYADLAYVALRICMGASESTHAMMMGLEKKLSQNKIGLDSTATMITNCQMAGANTDLSLQKILSIYQVNGLAMSDGSCRFWAYPDLDPAEVDEEGGAAGAKVNLSKVTGTQLNNMEQHLRVHTLKSFIRSRATDQDRNFRIIIDAFRTVVDQTVIDYAVVWPEGQNEIAPAPLAQNVSDALEALDIPAPQVESITITPRNPSHGHRILPFPAANQ